MNPSQRIWFIVKIYFEAFIWMGALIWLALSNDDFSGHAALCPLKSLGWSFCPGCGLGRSIILFFHGRIQDSFSMHPAGIPAVAVFIWRIVTLLKKNRQIIRNLNQTQ